MKFISVVSGCYNEENNVRELYNRVCRVLAEQLPEYAFEFIIIDNASKDDTVKVLKEIAASDKRVKVIISAEVGPEMLVVDDRVQRGSAGSTK